MFWSTSAPNFESLLIYLYIYDDLKCEILHKKILSQLLEISFI